jgi:hypothetical protein
MKYLPCVNTRKQYPGGTIVSKVLRFLVLVPVLLLALMAASSCTTGPVATIIVFTREPAGAVAGTAFTTQPVVLVTDNCGCTLTGYTQTVTLAITPGTGTSGAVLSGTATVNTVNGIATFSGLSINTAGAGYSLTATCGSLPPARSQTFNVEPPPTTTPGGS